MTGCFSCLFMANAHHVSMPGWPVRDSKGGEEAEGCPNPLERPRGKVTRLEAPIQTCCLAPAPPPSPLQGADVSPYLLLLLLFLLQLEGLHRPLHPDDGFHMVLKPVALHVGISTLDLVEHPEESPEDTSQSRGKAGRLRAAGGGWWPRGGGVSASRDRAGTSHTLCRERHPGPPHSPAARESAWGQHSGWS